MGGGGIDGPGRVTLTGVLGGASTLYYHFAYFYTLAELYTFYAKSLERSPAVGDFYGTRIEIWAGFGPVRQLLRPVFSCFHEQKKILKNILDGENIFGIE